MRHARRVSRLSLGLALAGVLLLAAIPVRAADTAADTAPDKAAVLDLLRAVIGVSAAVPADARTAGSLGTERTGSGVVIDDEGLIVTIGYLILEATQVTVTVGSETIPAAVVAYDHESGFGLIRADLPPDIQPMALGDSTELKHGAPVLAVSWQRGHAVTPARVASRRLFAGYWEYLLAGAIFTVPPHPHYGGAALVSTDGGLVGIGSLLVGDAISEDTQSPGNMFVPVEVLQPILADLLAEGRRRDAPAPWLGLFAREANGRVFVIHTAPEGPAESAGLEPGDVIIGVAGARVAGLSDFYRRVRALGAAGTDVPLDVVRHASPDLTIERVAVRSADRGTWLKAWLPQ